MDENNIYAFISEDIVVWNHIIAKFGAIKHFVEKNDSIRIANEEEERKYKEA